MRICDTCGSKSRPGIYFDGKTWRCEYCKTWCDEAPRETVTRPELFYVMDKKTAALKRIHRLCNDLLEKNELDTRQIISVKLIRELASTNYPPLEP